VALNGQRAQFDRQQRREPRLQRRYGKSGHRRRKDDVDLRGLDLCLLKRCEQRLLGQVERDFDVGIVCVGEAAELTVSRQPQRGVSELDPATESEPPKLRAGEVRQRADGFILGVPVWRELHGNSCDGRICCRNARRCLRAEAHRIAP